MLQQLKALSVHLLLDDFGTGYSSLSYLHNFRFDTLKIDRSFVSRLELSGKNAEIVRTIVSLARALQMEVVAEGVENISQLQQLLKEQDLAKSGQDRKLAWIQAGLRQRRGIEFIDDVLTGPGGVAGVVRHGAQAALETVLAAGARAAGSHAGR